MDGRHEPFDECEVVVDYLCQRSKAVCRARSIGDNLDIRLVALFVDSHNKHRCVSRRRRNDDLLRTALEVGLCLLSRGENTGRLDNVICSSVLPWNIRRVLFRVESDRLAVDNKVITLYLDFAFELTMLRIVLEHVCL